MLFTFEHCKEIFRGYCTFTIFYHNQMSCSVATSLAHVLGTFLSSTLHPPPSTLHPPPSTFYPPPFTLTLHPSPLHLSFRPTLQMHALDKDNTSRLPEPVQLGSSLLKRFERLVTSVYCNIVTFMTIYLDWGERSYQLLLPLSVSMSHLCGMLTSIITRTRYIHMYTNMCYYSVPGASEAHHSQCVF